MSTDKPLATDQFRVAHAAHADWRRAVDDCAAQLGAPRAAERLGFVYANDLYAEHLEDIVGRLTEATGITTWIGTVGIGVIAGHRAQYDEPALAALREDLSVGPGQDLRRLAGSVFAAFPVPNSDTGDYLVRNLVGLDVERGWVAVAEKIEIRQPILFCRRDRAAAEADLAAMARRVGSP